MANTNRDIPGENVDTLVRLMPEVRETYTGDETLQVHYGVDSQGKICGIRENQQNLFGVRAIFDNRNPHDKTPKLLRFTRERDYLHHKKLPESAIPVLEQTRERYNLRRLNGKISGVNE